MIGSSTAANDFFIYKKNTNTLCRILESKEAMCSFLNLLEIPNDCCIQVADSYSNKKYNDKDIWKDTVLFTKNKSKMYYKQLGDVSILGKRKDVRAGKNFVNYSQYF